MLKKITISFVFFILSATASWAANGRFTLVIDAGHGGHDAGALGAFSKEKDINLNVALAFGRYVEQNLPDVNVIYTRKRDVFIPLHQRADIANKAKADLFISVHTNSVVPGHYAKGFQVYTLGMHRAKDNLDVAMRENSVISMEAGYQRTYQGFDPKSSESYIMFEFMQNANMEKSVELARLIQNSVCASAGRIDKGVHQAGFLVLRESYMPSCLIELGFITAADEEEYLNSPGGIDAMAKGIYEAFVKYKNMYDTHIVVPFRTADNKRIAVGRAIPALPADTPRPVAPATGRRQPKRNPPAAVQKPAQKKDSQPRQKGTGTEQQKKLKVIDASRGIELIHDDEGDNPHVWLSVTDEIAQVRNIADQLKEADPAHADAYEKNAVAYIEKLTALKTEMHAALDNIPHKDIVTFHEAFPYFAKEFKLNIIGVVEREPGTEPTPTELQETIEQVNALPTKVLFTEPQYSPAAAETIARETGAKIYTLDPVVTGEATPAAKDAYIDTMKKNMKVLQEALQ